MKNFKHLQLVLQTTFLLASFTHVLGQTLIGASPYIVPNSGNYQIPAGVTSINVECIGGGGAGGGSGNASGSARGGGGGGAYVQVVNYTVAPNGILTVQVGAGGTGLNTTAVVNGQPSFVTYLSTTFIQAAGGTGTGTNTGGAGGQIASNIPVNSGFNGGNGGNGAICCSFNHAGGGGGGAAGTGGTGNNGSNGNAGSNSVLPTGGAGGLLRANFGGAGGRGAASDQNCPVTTGFPALANATNYGGGGGGCAQRSSGCGIASTGGSGARGLVRITYCGDISGLNYTLNTADYCSGVVITNNSPSLTIGTAVSYSISSTLPSGLLFNTTTGVISGTPSATSAATDYTITATNACGVITTQIVNITVQAPAVAPSAITGTTAICTGTTTTLTATGGNASTIWYTGSCGGTQVGNGVSYTTANLNSTTEFFVANSGCGGVTSCATVTVTVNSALAPTGITGISQICANNTSTLEATGGNANTKWFTGSCGGTEVGTGTTYTTEILIDTTQFFAANEECGVLSTCATITVNVEATVVAPLGITGNTSICVGDVTTLTAVGGNANTEWFTGSCGGTSVGTGASYTTNALNTAAKFFVANNGCGGFSTCDSVTVNVGVVAIAPTGISGITSICAGSVTTLTAIGGDVNTQWFTGSCGGTQVATGNSYTTSVLNSDTQFFATNSGCGGVSSCVNVTISLLTTPPNLSVVSGATELCQNATETYEVDNISGVDFTWILPNGFTGNSTTNQITITASNTGGTLSVVAENTCGSTTPSDLAIIVNPLPSVTLDTFAPSCTIDASFTLSGGNPLNGTYLVDNVVSTNFSPATGAGLYVVEYEFTDANNCTASAIQNIFVDVCSGINDKEIALLSVYPNPANQELIVSLNAGNFKVTMLDALGKQIAAFQFTSTVQSTNSINTAILPAGMYQIKVQAENGFNKNVKFMVNH